MKRKVTIAPKTVESGCGSKKKVESSYEPYISVEDCCKDIDKAIRLLDVIYYDDFPEDAATADEKQIVDDAIDVLENIYNRLAGMK